MRRAIFLLFALFGCEQPEVPVQKVESKSEGASLLWETQHDAALAHAKAAKKPVMIDFMAEWCVPCKELERKTYPDAAVHKELLRFVTVKIDTTNPTKEQEALLAQYRVQGLPTLVFIDSAGNVLTEPRVTGFVEPAVFAKLLTQVP